MNSEPSNARPLDPEAGEDLLAFFRTLAEWALIAEEAVVADVAVKRAKGVPTGDISRVGGAR